LAELQATVDEQKEEIDGYKKRLHKMVCTYPIYCVCIRNFRDNLKHVLTDFQGFEKFPRFFCLFLFNE